MQIDHHIRMCPVIAEAGGLEPYPQPMAAFAGAPTGTVQARIFDVSVQPPVELTSGGAIALASGLAASGLTNIPNSYVLDMGNAGVTSVVDAYTREGLEVVVMFEDSGGSQSPRYVKVTCNDADHVDALYPDGAIYADASSSVTGTSFPNGSIYRPVRNLGDACSILTTRGASLLDCKGTWDGNHNAAGGGVGGCRAADIGTALSSVRAIIRTRSTAAWYPDNSGDVIDLVDCSVISVNVPFGFSLSNFTNGTFFAGAPRLVNCRVQTVYLTGNGSRYGAASCTNCKIEGAIYLSANTSPGCYSADFLGCIWSTVQTVDFTSTYNFGFVTPTFVNCTGPITIANLGAGNSLAMTGMRGVGDITLAASVSSSVASVLVTGDYNSLINNAGIGSGSITEQKSAAYSDLVGNVVNLAPDAVDATSLADDAITAAKIADGAIDAATFAAGAIDNAAIAAGAITATEAPNLDVAVSTRAAPGAAMDLVNGAVDANAIANNAINVSAFASNAIDNGVLATSAVNEIRDAILSDSTPFNGATIATISTNVTTLLSRLGVNDMAILRGALLGNYILDGGSGDASANYDGNGCMTSGRIRIFADAAATQAASAGSTNGTDSEIYRVDITATPINGQAYPSTVTGVGQ